ncbi:mitochondrial carrier domain-containing protein [Spinellus fusiger]|nr:mitochondrial carrier domain-containing protein [Spinellus fusiger]
MVQRSVNPHRPYYTPGLHQHNYTSLNNETNLGLTPHGFVAEEAPRNMTTRITTFAAAKYLLTFLTSPFDVGITLLQVQYSPHEDVEVIGFRDVKKTLPIEPTDRSDSEEDNDDFYSIRPDQQRKDPLSSPRTHDSLSRSVYDEETRPVHQLAPMNGVLEILNTIVKQPTEGWMSLFKGQRITWVYEMARACLQPALEGALNDMFGLYDDTIPLMHLDSVTPNITTMVASHLVVGVLLSPLEIIRTRLIVQSSSSNHSKYKHLWHALMALYSEDNGGLSKLYGSTHLVPTVLYHTITPLLVCSTPLIIDRVFHVSASDSPILYGAAQLTMSTLGLCITLPLEVIRKRLHCQVPWSPKDSSPFETAVAVRPVPYKGMLDAVYKIMKEEGTKTKRTSKKSGSSSSSSRHDKSYRMESSRAHSSVSTKTSAWGIRGLYRGFGMQLSANVMLFVFHTINGIEGDFSD